ncbi:LysE family translocator [Sphingomonas sp. C3-2]|uniref:LysE family translocator n=1 Tax=Sphingomonas sp. C3-2 TaxID=3062169 RepID=UPI00294AC34D|nr:LysE family translocator [Sphingomonas sp. C3-2]WOK35833.1 LysE family translocator [Sphingomonas sp. C3-2]
MTIAQSITAFILAAGLLTITPGVDTAMVLRTAAVEGTRRAGFAVIGIAIGCLVWGAAVATGLGVLLAASEFAFTLVKWAGAAYLLWLAYGLLRHPRSGLAMDGAPGGGDVSVLGWLRRGLTTNLLNPKMGVFYISFLPQFVPQGMPMGPYSFMLASIHVVLGILWLGIVIAATVPLGRLLTRPAVIRALDRITGAVFVIFGVRLVFAQR